MAEPMTKLEAKAALDGALMTLGAARELIRAVEPTMRQFMDEARLMESVGPILHPTLFNSSERRAVEAMIKPFFELGLTFAERHDFERARVEAALAKVRANG